MKIISFVSRIYIIIIIIIIVIQIIIIIIIMSNYLSIRSFK